MNFYFAGGEALPGYLQLQLFHGAKTYLDRESELLQDFLFDLHVLKGKLALPETERNILIEAFEVIPERVSQDFPHDLLENHNYNLYEGTISDLTTTKYLNEDLMPV